MNRIYCCHSNGIWKKKLLHIINKSPFTHSGFTSCLRFAKAKDPILFYEDGVLAVQAKSRIEPIVKAAMSKHFIFALQEDLMARGITDIIDGIRVINYSGFVDLVEENKVNSWL